MKSRKAIMTVSEVEDGKIKSISIKTLNNNLSEDDICMAIVEWSEYVIAMRDVLVHIANERNTSVQHHMKLKKMGVRKGVSDFFLPVPCGSYCGLWVEVKKSLKKDTPENREKKLKPEQKDWLNKMNDRGFIGVATFGYDETKKMFEQYLEEPDDIEIVRYVI